MGTMQLSLFLAKLLGLYTVIVCIAFLVRRKDVPVLVDAWMKDTPLMVVSGAFTLILGLAIVLAHNVWTPDWRGAVTLLGWMGVLKGVLRLFLPTSARSWAKGMVDSPWYALVLLVFFAVGVWLTYVGFTYMP